MKINLIVLAAFACAASLVAEVKNLAAKDLSFPVKNVKIAADGTMTATGATYFTGKNLIKIEPGKKYGIAAVINQKCDTMCYVGFNVLDKDRKEIRQIQAIYRAGTFTTLVADVKPGDKVIKVKDAAKWIAAGNMGVAFFAKPDNSDLPNRNAATNPVVKKEQKDGVWEITLRNPLKITAKAGTGVREHIDGGFVYVGYSNKPFSNPAKRITSWYPGAVFIQPIFLINWSKPKDNSVPVTAVKNFGVVIE